MIPLTERDKDYMSPMTKMLIMDRWTTFRGGNWSLYNHLKQKVKEETEMQKDLGKNLMRTSNELWRLVSKQRRVPFGGLSSLLDEFGSECDLLESLTEQLKNHFLQATYTYMYLNL